MSFSLHVAEGPDKGQRFVLFQENSVLLGRSKHANSRLNDLRISRVHCEVELRGNKVTISDLDSQGGTFVNGKRVSEHLLQVGDKIRIGETTLRLEGPSIHEQSTLPPPARPVPLPSERMGELSGRKMSHYEVGPILAKAQSGMVYKATDFKNDRQVAFKILWPEFSKSDDEMARFVRAMKTMLPHKHPNLVRLYGAGKTGPYCWIAMEFVDGESLTQIIQRIGTAGMLDWRHAFRVAVDIGKALEYAHGQSIVHRNITPQNIIVQKEPKLAKLGDLMLAKAQEGTMAQQVTKPGEILGDLRFMPPERTTGAIDVDARSDIYSLGATLYALLTGRPPCEGTNLIDIIQKIRSAEPVRPKKYQLAIPDSFEGIVMKMLAKSPDGRYLSATELLKDLDRVAKSQRITM